MVFIIKLFLLGILIIFFFIAKKDKAYAAIFILAQFFIIPEHLMTTFKLGFRLNIMFLETFILLFMVILDHTLRRESSFPELKQYKKVFFIYFFTCCILFLYPTQVPYSFQFVYYLNEIRDWILILLVLFLINKEKHIQLLVQVLAICVIINSLYGIFTYIIEFNIFGAPLYAVISEDSSGVVSLFDSFLSSKRGEMYRVQSIFGHPLSLGQIFGLSIPFFIYFKKYIHKYIFIILMISIFALIFLSGSRSSLIPVLLICIYLLYKHLGAKKIVVYAFLFLIGFIFLININPKIKQNEQIGQVLALFMFWDEDLQSEYKQRGSSLEMRENQYSVSLEKLEKVNPLVGYGRGYREYYAKEEQESDPELLGYESIVLLKLVEQGFIGLFSFFFVIFLLFLFYYRKKGNTRPYILALYGFYILSIIMTGVRSYSFILFIIFNGLIYRFDKDTDKNISDQKLL